MPPPAFSRAAAKYGRHGHSNTSCCCVVWRPVWRRGVFTSRRHYMPANVNTRPIVSTLLTPGVNRVHTIGPAELMAAFMADMSPMATYPPWRRPMIRRDLRPHGGCKPPPAFAATVVAQVCRLGRPPCGRSAGRLVATTMWPQVRPPRRYYRPALRAVVCWRRTHNLRLWAH